MVNDKILRFNYWFFGYLNDFPRLNQKNARTLNVIKPISVLALKSTVGTKIESTKKQTHVHIEKEKKRKGKLTKE